VLLLRIGGWLAYDDGIGEENRVGNYDSLARGGSDHGGACLDIFDFSFEAGDIYPVADLKGLLHQDQDSGEKILQNILKGEANRYATDSEHFDEVCGVKGRRQGGEGGQETNHENREVHQLTKQQPKISVTISALTNLSDEGSGSGCENQEHNENDQRQNEIGKECDRCIKHPVPTLPGIGNVDLRLKCVHVSYLPNISFSESMRRVLSSKTRIPLEETL
jgi:hypothetical protein